MNVASYSRKTIQSLKPIWYLKLSKSEKEQMQKKAIEDSKSMWENKPILLKEGTCLIAKSGGNSITKGCKYYVKNHFCTLVSTIYDTEWHHFVTIKNNNDFTIKTNLRKFEIIK